MVVGIASMVWVMKRLFTRPDLQRGRAVMNAAPSHYTNKTLTKVDMPSSEPIVMKEVLPNGTAMVLYNVLSPIECKHYMEEAQRIGMLQLSGGSRVTDRSVAMSAEVAELVFDRCKPFLHDIN